MLYEKYEQLIERLSNCNGDDAEELQKHVEDGTVSEKEAPWILLHARLRKTNKIASKVKTSVDAL